MALLSLFSFFLVGQGMWFLGRKGMDCAYLFANLIVNDDLLTKPLTSWILDLLVFSLTHTRTKKKLDCALSMCVSPTRSPTYGEKSSPDRLVRVQDKAA